MNQDYFTKDIGIASTLLTLGIKMKTLDWRIEAGYQVAYFVFENKSGECSRYSHNYNFGRVMVNAKTYQSNLRMLKRELFIHINKDTKTTTTQ